MIVHADQRQFAIQDKPAAKHDRTPRDLWSSEALTSRIAAEHHRISIATARSDLVEVTVTIHKEAPGQNPEAEHIAEADLITTAGELTIAGPADYPKQEHHLPAEPGEYRVRVSYVESEPPQAEWNDFEYGAHYRYEIDLWPTEEQHEPKIVKQGEEVWDG